jgi:hypothetical protein
MPRKFFVLPCIQLRQLALSKMVSSLQQFEPLQRRLPMIPQWDLYLDIQNQNGQPGAEAKI